jgi:hypothetical protein
MLIELIDTHYARTYGINSRSAFVISEWLKEWLPTVMISNSVALPWQIRIWADDETESEYWKDMNNLPMTLEGLTRMGEVIGEVIAKETRRLKRLEEPEEVTVIPADNTIVLAKNELEETHEI